MTDLRLERNARLMGPYFDEVASSVAMPERGLDELLATVARTPQRRRFMLPRLARRSLSGVDTVKFALAGVVVALFGGLLLAGGLTNPPESDRLVTGSTPTASAVPPVDAIQAESLPDVELPTAATPSASPATSGTSPGFWDVLITKPVVPGVREVLRDTAGNDLGRAWSTAISSSGDIWIARKNSLVRAGHADTIPVDPAGRARGLPDHLIEQPGGQMSFAPPQGNLVFSGSEWVPITGANVDYDAALNAGAIFDEPTTLLRDGALWGHSIDFGREPSAWPIITRFDATGPVRFSSDQHGLAAGRDDCESRMPNHHKADKICGIHGAVFEAAPDGVTWAGFSGYGGGLARFDGSEWSTVRPTGAAPHFGVRDIVAAPDGTIWVAFEERRVDFQPDGGTKLKHLEKRLYLARLDGDDWMTFKVPQMVSVRGHAVVAPDGTLWWDGGEHLTSFDGRQWKTYPPSGAFRLDENHLSIGPDGSVLLAVRREVRDDDSGHERVLYLLDPDEAATGFFKSAKVRAVPQPEIDDGLATDALMAP